MYKGTGDKSLASSYFKYQIQGTTGYKTDLNGGTPTAVTSFTWGSVTRTVAEETQNFANWFSYYRSRVNAAKAGSSIAFSKLGTNYRVGFSTINTDTLGNAIPTSGTFDGTNRQNWFSALLGATIPPQGTPLKESLKRAGEYFSRSDDTGPYGPAPQLSCRRNFTILTTDGYYNPPDPALNFANEDNLAGTTITGPGSQSYQYQPARPYMDSYGGTLADIAMYYWKRDLRSDLTNNIRTTSTNPSFWQNMSTFTLSLGPQGTLTPPPKTPNDLAALTSGSKVWPDPATGEAKKIDDLWHASVNGRGTFVAAKNPTEFAEGLVSALNTIGESGGAWNVALTSSTVETDGRVFVARYDGSWGGDLWAVAYNSTGNMNTTADGTPIPLWKASEQLPAAASRKIFTWKDNGGGGIAFTYSNLSNAKQTAIGGSDVVDFVRGVTSKSVASGGTLRNRSSLLGDIANPAPVYVKASNTVFAAANDGMLHAFNASTGAELFAYIPGGVNFADLNAFSSPTYSHKFINDGEIAVSDLAATGKNILVGSLGRGGKTVYALDVTTPSSFGGNNVLWEFTDTDLGNTLGKPVIVKLNTGDWAVIIGNGYNSASERAFLFVINLNTGALIKKIDTGAGSSSASNGLATPVGFDQNGDGKVDLVYAGDLLGNFWKFNLSGSTTTAWTGTSMFVAKDASSNVQPITGGLSIAIDPTTNKRWVFGGTGRYLSNADVSSKAVQSWYGLIDDGTTISSRASLLQRTLNAESAQGSYTTRTFSAAATNDMVGKKGWYADLTPASVASGERIVSRSQYSAGVLYVSSIIPSSDVCASGGSGFVNAVDAFSGANLVKPFFDINNDKLFTDADKKSEGGKLVSAGSIRTTGMIGELNVKKVSSDQSTAQTCDTTGACKGLPNLNLRALTGRISWREIVTE
jgi:type IV pilus assembly protein PilY1